MSAIRAESLSKRYRVGGLRVRHQTLSDVIAQRVRGRLGRPSTIEGDGMTADLWALRDVTFSVGRGEVLGLVGRNGAGKSTLLKVLTRIARPSAGWAEIGGRVGSLLEVGTGFHPELTGRENVYLNGAILGMRRSEITRRFDEIVAFAEVERFLDTAIKHYSSGMSVRLAFSVAAHLECEILLVDEVLAVGDVAFQRRCLGKMREVATDGRTVVFVSHNMALVRAFCGRGLYIDHGSVRVDGTAEEAVGAYLADIDQSSGQDLRLREDRSGWGEVLLVEASVRGLEPAGGALLTGAPAEIRLRFAGAAADVGCSVTIATLLGQPVATLSSHHEAPGDGAAAAPDEFSVLVDELPLGPGRYRLDVSLTGRGRIQDRIEGAVTFDVAGGLMRGRPVTGDEDGPVAIAHVWERPKRA